MIIAREQIIIAREQSVCPFIDVPSRFVFRHQPTNNMSVPRTNIALSEYTPLAAGTHASSSNLSPSPPSTPAGRSVPPITNHTNEPQAAPSRVAEWRRNLTRERPAQAPRFNLDHETDELAASRKKYTLVLRNLVDGDVMAPSARWPDKYSALTGGLEIAGVDIVLEKGAVLTDEEKAQTAWGWRSYSMIKNGVPFTATRATLFYETAVSYGFSTTAEYVNAIVAPYLNKFGIAVTYTNAAAPPPVYTLRIYSTPTTFRIGGDTFQVNKMLIKFKQFGLDFVRPFWIPKDNAIDYDHQPVLDAINGCNRITAISPDNSVHFGAAQAEGEDADGS